MKLVLLFLLIAVLYNVHCKLTDEEINKKWTSFKTKYRKSYGKVHNEKFRGLTEEHFRKKIFTKKAHLIDAHNQKYKKGLESYKMTINKFADMTKAELKPYTRGRVRSSERAKPTIKITKRKSLGRKSIPKSVDWRTEGVVTPVKNQGNCGSCWAFAANGVLESHVLKSKGAKHQITASEQELVDCSRKNLGCNGGTVDLAYDYVRKKGISSDTNYIYTGKHRQACRRKHYPAAAKIKGFAEMSESDDEHLLAQIVATKGPVAVAINAEDPGFSYYEKGVYYNPSCSQEPGHAVIVVGYGSENGTDYWIVKNSWGTDWGDQGYIKMARNRNNLCGIATEAFYPIV